MTNEQKQWITETATEAQNGGHAWPEYAACEAALESRYGQSQLAQQAHNLFGQKSRASNPYGELDLPTWEIINGERINTTAHWISYPSLALCFKDRMATLQRLRHAYPHYGAALDAQDGETYVREVSHTWSTDPERADKVLSIYNKYKQLN